MPAGRLWTFSPAAPAGLPDGGADANVILSGELSAEGYTDWRAPDSACPDGRIVLPPGTPVAGPGRVRLSLVIVSSYRIVVSALIRSSRAVDWYAVMSGGVTGSGVAGVDGLRFQFITPSADAAPGASDLWIGSPDAVGNDSSPWSLDQIKIISVRDF